MAVETQKKCTHCGEECPDEKYRDGDYVFCCHGCQMIYHLLRDHGLGAYYQYESFPGNSQSQSKATPYHFLDTQEVVDKLLSFKENNIAKITLHLPDIHCSSCLWLLENISRIDPGILHCRVNFSSKKASITYNMQDTSLRSIVGLLDKIGYPPKISFEDLQQNQGAVKTNHSLLLKLGLAGFSFGNIMLLSFPEYLGFKNASEIFFIGYINLFLAFPVLLYSGFDYIRSAYKGLKQGQLNIDLPIALGMITLFSKSTYDILTHSGEGYLDSFTGFVFFLLVGRWFQDFTYHALDFDRTYKSYFPVSSMVLEGDSWVSKAIDQILPGDILRINNQELIPVDGVITGGKARIDYSFVTGESELISKVKGEEVYAGGRHNGESLFVKATKKVDQSYLTQLWNEDIFKKSKVSKTTGLINIISKYFTVVVLVIAFGTAIYWWNRDPSMVWNVFTAVLIVACPCALALAIPFTYGHILRLLAQDGFFLKNTTTIEHIQDVDTIVFDKTGTITDSGAISLSFSGAPLSFEDSIFIRSACMHSSHPLSKAIADYLKEYEVTNIDSYEEIIGEGFIAKRDEDVLRLGSSAFIFGVWSKAKQKGVFVEINGKYLGFFKARHALRPNIRDILDSLGNDNRLVLLSGDTDRGQEMFYHLFEGRGEVYFEQKPKDKLKKIESMQNQGYTVMMIGDGLNDSGALKQSDIGIVVSDSTNNFSPACDGILDASLFGDFHFIIRFLRRSRYIIYGAFVMALLYNSIGLYFAVSGRLSPVIAALLMPISSISVIIYGVVSSYLLYRFTYKTKTAR